MYVCVVGEVNGSMMSGEDGDIEGRVADERLCSGLVKGG